MSRRFRALVFVVALTLLLSFLAGSVLAAPLPSPQRQIDPQSVLAFLKATLALIWSYAGVKVITGHVLVNVVVALAAAQYTSSLDLSKLVEFLTKKLLPFLGVYAICKIFGEDAGLPWLAPAVWTIIEATLASNLLENLNRLGVPLPDALARVVVKR